LRRDHVAFAELVRRHGPTVFGACRRILGDSHDAEDAFQAVFLVLVRKASTIRPPGAIGGWLYGVAVRTANKAKVAAARRRRREMIAATQARPDQNSAGEVATFTESAELRSVLDAELAKLPDALRAAIVLCDLHGKTRAEAAIELGCPEGTVAARLHRARKKLGAVLSRRGLVLPATGLASVLAPAPVSATLTQAAFSVVSGFAPSAVHALAREVIRSMTTTTHMLAVGFLALVTSGLIAAGTLLPLGGENPGMNTSAPPVELAATAPDTPTPPDHGNSVYSVSYAPDGKQFVSVGNGKAIVWDSETQKKLFATEAQFAAFSGDGKNLFVLVRDEFRTLDATTGKTLGTKKRQQPQEAYVGLFAAFSDTATMWVEYDGVRHHLRNTGVEGEIPVLADQHEHNPLGSTIIPNYGRGGAFQPGGKLFAGIHAATTAHKDVTCLTIWQSESGKRVGTISRGFNHPVYAFAWSPDGKELAVGYGDGVRVYEAETLKETRKLQSGEKRQAEVVTALAWSHDGKTLAVANQAAITTNSSSSSTSTDGGNTSSSTSSSSEVVTAMPVVVRLVDAQTGKELRMFDQFADNLPVISLAFRRDGKQLVCGAGFFPHDAPAINWPQPRKTARGLHVLKLDEPTKTTPPGWKERESLSFKGWLAGSVAFDPSGETLYVGGTNGHASAYTADTLKQLWESREGGHYVALAISPDGKTVATTVGDGVRLKDGVRFLDATTGKTIASLEEKDSNPTVVAFFPDIIAEKDAQPVHRIIFGNARGYQVKTWQDIATVSTITTSTVAAGKEPADTHAVPLAVAPDGSRAVVAGPMNLGKNVVWAWSAGLGARNQLLEGHNAIVTSAAWSADGKLIVTADANGVVITWDAVKFKETSRLTLGARVAAVAISAENKHVAAAVVRSIPGIGQGAYAEEVFVWQLASPPKKPEPISHNEAGAPFKGTASIAFSPSGDSLAATFCNFTHLTRLGELVGKVRIFTLESETPKAEQKPGFVSDIRFSPDGKRYAVVTSRYGVATRGEVQIHDTASGKILFTVVGEAAGYSPDGKTLFVMSTNVLECDASTGKVLREHARPKTNFQLHHVAFSPDGKQCAAFSGHDVGIYDTATGAESVKLADQLGNPGFLVFGDGGMDIVFSPDGKRVAAVGVGLKPGAPGAAMWDTETGKRLQVFEPVAEDAPRAAVFSPDSKLFAIAYKDQVEVWDLSPEAKKNPLRKFRTPLATALAFSKDGKLLAIGMRKAILGGKTDPPQVVGYHSEVQLLNAETGEEVKRYDGFENGAATTTLAVTALAFNPDGKKLIAGTGLHHAELSLFIQLSEEKRKELPRASEVKVFLIAEPEKRDPDDPGKPKFVQSFLDTTDIRISPDGTRYAVVAAGQVRVHDAATQKQLYAIAGEAAGYSTDGKTLFVMSTKVLECDAASGKVLKEHPRAKPRNNWQSVSFSPDGKRYAAHFGFNVALYDTATGFEPVRLDEQFWIDDTETAVKMTARHIVWSPDGKRLAADGVEVAKHTLGLAWWEPEAGTRTGSVKASATDAPRAIAFGETWDAEAVGWNERVTVRLSGKDPDNEWPTAGLVSAVALSAARKLVAVAVRVKTPEGPQTQIQLLDAKTGKEIRRLGGFTSNLPVPALAFDKEAKRLYASTTMQPNEATPEVKVFDLTVPEKAAGIPAEQHWNDLAILTNHAALVNGVAVSPDGKLIAAATENNVTCWDSTTHKMLWQSKLGDAPAYALTFSADSKHLFVAGKTEVIRLDAANGEKVEFFAEPLGNDGANYLIKTKNHHARSLAISQDGKRLAMSDGYMAWMVEPANPATHGTFGGPAPKDAASVPSGVAWSNDGKLLASISPKRTDPGGPISGIKPDTHWPVKVWSTEGKGLVLSLQGHDKPVTAIAWSKDGKVIASGGEDGLVILWDAETGKELWRHEFKGRDDTIGRINALGISPADNTIAVAVDLGSGQGADRVTLLAPSNGQVVGQVMRWRIRVSSVAWSPDGKFFVTGCGEAGRSIPRDDTPVGEVVIWVRRPN
jgi:RNA polymerase sigma factor (sigma-70 family)